LKEDLPSERVKELLIPTTIKKKPAEGSTSSNSLKNISPPEGGSEQAEGTRISPSNIFTLPKEKAAIRRYRSGRRSVKITCSPFKNSILNVTKKMILQDPTRPKEKLCDELTVGGHLVQEIEEEGKGEYFLSCLC
jgi:hypothetical protein